MQTVGDELALHLFSSACLVWLFFYFTEHWENNAKAKLDNHTNAVVSLAELAEFQVR